MTQILLSRVDEDFALVEKMLALVPADSADWRPSWPGDTPFTVTELAAHLAESFGGVCGCFARLDPSLAGARVDPTGLSLADSVELIGVYRRLVQGVQMTEADLGRVIPTYFVPEGEPFLAALLTNLKHVNHHAHQLFIYLKLLGVPVGTRHLYRFR